MSVNKYFPDKFCREKCPQDKFPQPLSSADLQIMVYLGILVTRKNLSWQKIPEYLLHFVKIGRIFLELPLYLAEFSN